MTPFHRNWELMRNLWQLIEKVSYATETDYLINCFLRLILNPLGRVDVVVGELRQCKGATQTRFVAAKSTPICLVYWNGWFLTQQITTKTKATTYKLFSFSSLSGGIRERTNQPLSEGKTCTYCNKQLREFVPARLTTIRLMKENRWVVLTLLLRIGLKLTQVIS